MKKSFRYWRSYLGSQHPAAQMKLEIKRCRKNLHRIVVVSRVELNEITVTHQWLPIVLLRANVTRRTWWNFGRQTYPTRAEGQKFSLRCESHSGDPLFPTEFSSPNVHALVPQIPYTGKVKNVLPPFPPFRRLAHVRYRTTHARHLPVPVCCLRSLLDCPERKLPTFVVL